MHKTVEQAIASRHTNNHHHNNHHQHQHDSSSDDEDEDSMLNQMSNNEEFNTPLDQRIARTLAAAAVETDNDHTNRIVSTSPLPHEPNFRNSRNTRTATAYASSRDQDTDDDRSANNSPVPDPAITTNYPHTTALSTTTTSTPPTATTTTATNPPVNLSQNFELSLSTNEQLYHLLKEAHLSNERLTARVHELERANQALIAAAQQQAAAALASPSLDSKQRPGSFHGADGARMGHNNNSNNSSSTTNGGGVALSTLVAERDAALSEMEVLEARARDAEKNADNMVDAMRQANDALSADMREAQESLVQSERQVVQLRTTIDEKDMIIRNSTTMVERSKVEMTKMKAEVKEAQETARKATTKKQRLESQSLDLKRRLNQLAQDLVASEDDLKITAMNKIRVEQNVIGLRKEIKKLRGNALRLKNNYDREKLHKKEVGNRLQAERKNRRREHENSSRRILQLENQRSSGNHLLTSGSTTSLDASANQRSTMEIELLKAQREESKLKDASLIELSNQVKMLTASNDRLTFKCNDYEQLNVVLSTENKVCISLLSAARRREGTNKVESY